MNQFEQQRDANERLVLALLRESRRADAAEDGRTAAMAAERELRNVAEFRERLIGIVGHDLRNPLNAVMMASGLLLSGGKLPLTEAHLAGRILDAGHRMKRIIVQLLEFTRARLGGGFVLDRTRTDLGDVCRRITAELRLASGRDIHLDEIGDVSGVWDAELLGEVFSNIIGNAVEYGERHASIQITLAEQGPSVIAAVTNRGPTIPADVLSHLFDPFRRADDGETARAAGNLGLGLYIASEIVNAHGGAISVRSAQGDTTFTIVLPRELA